MSLENPDKTAKKNELQNQIKKLLTSSDGCAILLKLSREGLLHNSKKNKKVVDKYETLCYNIKAVA